MHGIGVDSTSRDFLRDRERDKKYSYCFSLDKICIVRRNKAIVTPCRQFLLPPRSAQSAVLYFRFFSLPPSYLICATPFWGDETGRSSLLCEGQRRSFGLIYGQHLCCLFDCRRSSARRLQMAPLREKRVALCSRFMKISSLFRNILRQPLTMFVSNGSLLYQKMKKRLDEMWN